MKRFIILIILLLLNGNLKSDDCWAWRDLGIETPQAEGPVFMAYDEQREKVAMVMQGEWGKESNKIMLWYLDGERWELEGTFYIKESDWSLYSIIGFYFDKSINKLVIIGAFSKYYSGFNGAIAYNYDEKKWEFLADDNENTFNCFAVEGYPYLSYDEKRKRTVITSCVVGFLGPSYSKRTSDEPKFVTVEFDGNEFYVKENPEGIYLNRGVSAYDPEIEKVVYYGENNYYFKDSKERSYDKKYTFEYDGENWVEIENADNGWECNMVFGMVYFPYLKGIISVSIDNYHLLKTIIYKDKKFNKLDIISKIPDPWVIGYHKRIDKIILYANSNMTGKEIYRTYVLEKGTHCRPF